jgi:pimeloyl-ACP methyl ester carboxylesterase
VLRRAGQRQRRDTRLCGTRGWRARGFFIHGCCTDYRAWDAQRQAIAPHYCFVGLNLRYHGTGPWPDDGSKCSHQTHADDIAAFIRGLNAGPVDLVGWSYSGLIVMLVTVQHPERPTSTPIRARASARM